MTVELTSSVDWLAHCYPHDGGHEHVSVYLIRAADGFVLVDSGSVYHRREIRVTVREATGGTGLDSIILSHSDYPHSGNISQLGAGTDEVELIASSGSPEQQGLPDARKATIGGELTIQGQRFSFIDPPLADRSHTAWIYDHANGVLFTADGFGSYHEQDRCEAGSTDFENGIPAETVYEYHRDNLMWLRYVDPGKLQRALADIFDSYDVRAIAPVHGHPIVGDDIEPYLDAFYDAAVRIADEYEVQS